MEQSTPLQSIILLELPLQAKMDLSTEFDQYAPDTPDSIDSADSPLENNEKKGKLPLFFDSSFATTTTT